MLRLDEKRRILFEEVALVHVRALLRTAVRLTRDPFTAEDLVQDTVLRAWKSFAKFEPGTNCRAWLFKIMLNAWKSTGRAEEIEELPADGGVDARGLDGASRVLMHEVVSAVDRLPEEQRLVLLLSAVEGFTSKEIAEMLEIPMGTVMSRIARGRAAVRKVLEPGALEIDRSYDAD